MGREIDRDSRRPVGSKPKGVIEVCLVPDCSRVVDARGLCKKHHQSLSRALKAGVPWDAATGQAIDTGHRPEPPGQPVPPDRLHRYPFLENLPQHVDHLNRDELQGIKHQVEVDAARILPFALAYCIGRTLQSVGVLDDPEVATAFAQSCQLPVASRLPTQVGSEASGEGRADVPTT
jgi:hypothetical protein